MKRKLLIFSFVFLLSAKVNAQDTLILTNNYKFKVGVKVFFERSGDVEYTSETSPVTSFGIQGIYKLGHSKSSIESGLYYLNRANVTEYYYIVPGYSGYSVSNFLVSYGNIHIPINYRLDTRIIYFSTGIYFDYLVKTTSNAGDRLDTLLFYGEDRKLNLGYNLNLGFEKAFSNNLSLFVEAELSYNLSTSKTGSEFFNIGNEDGALANSGFVFGINYKLLRKN